MDPYNPAKYRFEPNPAAALDGPAYHEEGFGYWLRSAENRRYSESKLTRFISGDYPAAMDGRPVHPSFHIRRHVYEGGVLLPSRSSPLVIGVDCGLTPAACIGQMIGKRLCIFAEVLTEDCTAVRMIADHLIPLLRTRFPGFSVIASLDPAAMQRQQVDGKTVFAEFAKAGITPMVISKGNRLAERIDALDHYLERADCFGVDKVGAPETIKALAGGFRWKDSKNKVNSRMETDKLAYHSHLGDAIQYLGLYFKNGGSADVQGAIDDIFEGFGVSYADSSLFGDSVVASYPQQEAGYLFV